MTWYHLYNLKKVKNTNRGVILATLLKVPLLHGCFLRFLNCRNSTKLWKASHMMPTLTFNGLRYKVLEIGYVYTVG